MLKPDIIQISGPVGLLETICLPAAQTPARGVAVINHP
ncbi:MAG: alpha/beta hydrolase, partial [Neisseria sp.]|nr:alpha/beta hydrolase [Neisseria sp.]